MRNIGLIAVLEWRRLWSTAMPYLTGALFVGLSGYFFCMLLFVSHHADLMPAASSNMLFFLLILIPFLTMRLFVEDRLLGTDVLLHTAPLTVTQIVLGKYLSVLATMSVFLVATAPIPLSLMVLGDPDMGMLLGSYVAMFLFVVAVSAIGMWASSVARHYVVAALLAFGVLMLVWLSGALGAVFQGVVGVCFDKIAMPNHVMLLQQGIVTADDLAYFGVVTSFFLVLTGVSVVFRREVA
jgi:ABC-2 type transport system permease protein